MAQGAALIGALVTAWALGAPVPARAEPSGPSAGTYLAARAAERAMDLPAAAALHAQALEEDPANPRLLESALVAALALGRLPEARDLAARLREVGPTSPVAHLTLAAGQARDGDWRGLLQGLEAGRQVSPLADGLARSWAWLGMDDAEAALSAFDELAATPGAAPFGLYHKALALALTGDLAGAEAILARPESEGMQRTRRSVLAHAEILGALGRQDEGLRLIEDSFGTAPDAALLALRARLAAGGPMAFGFIASPAEGLGEAYFNIAAALAGEDPRTALLYARAALGLEPGQPEAALLAGSILADLGQPDLAQEAYAAVSPDDPAFVAAELGRASALRGEGEPEAAREVLSRLAGDHPDRPEVQADLADLLRTLDRHAEAEAAYDRAIAATPDGSDALWYLHFTRALARQQQENWPGAEADLRRALQLRPDQPQVLNHLGYTLVDRGEKLVEALDMIERAVALRPDSGAIVDSLGWAYYKLGRHAEAVEQLERAASLAATDPVVNDHLGDAYWSMGREREARFQWNRALHLEPATNEAERIRQKLALGLDAVVAAETAALAPESAGG